MVGPPWDAFVGTYTDGPADGIYALRIDADGVCLTADLAVSLENPSFLAVHPSGEFLYAVNETDAGRVTACEVERDPLGLEVIDRTETGGGADPAHCVVDPRGDRLLVAHYTGGSVASVPLGPDGAFTGEASVVRHEGSGPDPDRQAAPHPHAVAVGPGDRYCYVPDLGTDRIRCYDFEASGLEREPAGDVEMPPGSGPRQVAFHPFGEYGYVVDELDSTIGVLAVDPDGPALDLVQTVSTLPERYDGANLAAAGQIHDSGRWAYASNRGHDSIARFEVTPATGKLRSIAHHTSGGGWPRDFALSPDGAYLLTANKSTHEVVSFALDRATGDVADTVGVAGVPNPVCIQFLDGA